MRIACTLLFAMLWTLLASQSADTCGYTLSGRVLDEHNNAPLEFATVYLVEVGRGTVTDADGNFAVTGMCAGDYTLRGSHIGCEPVERRIRMNGDRELTLRLEHHAELLETVELRASKVEEAGSVSRSVLSVEDIEREQGLAFGESLRRLPGVSAIQTGPAIFKPVIHGLHSNRLLIISDGLRQESQQWGLDHAPEIDPFIANEIVVVKGTPAVQYGADAVGGVVLVRRDSLMSDRGFRGKVALSGMTNGWQGSTSAMLEKGFANGFGVRWHGTLKRSGDKHAPDYNLTNTGFREASTSVSAGYRKGLNFLGVSYSLFHTEIGILRSAHIGNLTDLEEALDRGEPFFVEPFSYAINNPRQNVIHHTFKVDAKRHWEDVGILSGFYAFQINKRQEFDIRRGNRDNKPALDLNLMSQTGEISLSHNPLFNNLTGKAAIHWNYRQNSNVPGTGVRPLIPNYSMYVPGVSLVEKWITNNFEIEAGFRYEYALLRVKKFDRNSVLRESEFNYHSYATSLGTRWQVNDYVSVNANLGSTRRAPNVNELFSEGLHHGAAAIEEGDTSLIPEQAVKLVIGTEIQQRRFSLQLTGYTQSITDFIYLRPEGEPRLTIRGAFPVFKYVQNDVWLSGIDAAGSVLLVNGLDLIAKYSMVRANNRDEGQPLIFMPADRMQLGLKWTSNNERFEAGATMDHVWEQTRAPEGLDYAPPPGAYTLLQLDFGVGFDLGNNKLDTYLTVRNALNTSYREYLNRLRYFADDIGRNIEIRLIYNFSN